MTDETSQNEQKSERFNMFMSPSEMEAIDHWSWANRIRSKSEAVRRLCQIGLLVGSELEHLSGDLLQLSEDLSQLNSQTFAVWTAVISPLGEGDTLDRGAIAAVLEDLLEKVSKVDGGVDIVSSALVGLFSAVAGAGRAGNVAEMGEMWGKVISETNANIAKVRELRTAMEENRKHIAEHGYPSKKPSKGDDI